ncbi:uncharacterized protein [Rutidosis leptorrhynchoides]|uniref:uncharacterized protein n=1 Tax=Rutidosis leptorrhynchoides TaxID=125765 RepID=UPI003A99A3AB
MSPYEMLYGRSYRTPICWGEVGQREVGSTDLVLETNSKIEMIRARLNAAQNRQKSYADKRRRPIEFEDGDMVMLKVSPWKDKIVLNKKLEYVEEPMAILDEKVKRLRNKEIRTYKVQWRHRKGSEVT